MITRTYTNTIELTPEELAFEFCRMDDGEQAKFFNEVARLTKEWDRPFCFQLQNIIENKELTNEGRYIMESIGEYGKP